MDSTFTEQLQKPIVAIVCEDRGNHFSIIDIEPECSLKDFDFQEDMLYVGNLAINFNWYNSIVICTEENLQELKQELQIA